jgi:hypothetical protein
MSDEHVGLITGVALGMFFTLFLMGFATQTVEKMNTINKLCNDKFGNGNWEGYTQNGYWYCKPIMKVQDNPPFDGYGGSGVEPDIAGTGKDSLYVINR